MYYISGANVAKMSAENKILLCIKYRVNNIPNIYENGYLMKTSKLELLLLLLSREEE